MIGRGYEAFLLDTGKVCLCPTNCHLYHKDPCPIRGNQSSKVGLNHHTIIQNPIERWDRWDVRLPNPKDQQKVISLYLKSGAKSKSDFVRARLLGEPFKVITVDKSAVEYNRKLSEFTALLHKIGVLYNQAVKAINTYHSPQAAQMTLRQLEKYAQLILGLQEQIIQLTIDYRKQANQIQEL